MTALVLVESCFGNTAAIAREVADALGAALVAAADAPAAVPADIDLLIVAAPTHNLGLPSAKSRALAAERGAQAPVSGVREWIEAASPTGARTIAIDTSVASGRMLGTAAKAAHRALRRRGFRAAERGPSFTVAGTPAVLAEGELPRAREWASALR